MAGEHRTDVIQRLLEEGADPNMPSSKRERFRALHYAAASKDDPSLDLIDLLIKFGADLKGRDGEDRTPLHVAIWKENAEAVIRLLNRGADVNPRDKRAATPLHFACERNLARIGRQVIQGGADLNARDIQEEPPLYYVLKSKQRQEDLGLLNALLETMVSHDIMDDSMWYGALIVAVRHGNTAALSLLCEHILPARSVDARPRGTPQAITPFLCAVRQRSRDAVDILLKSGANPNLVVKDETPLCEAIMGGGEDNIAIATQLLEAGADVELRCDKVLGYSMLGALIALEGFGRPKAKFIELLMKYKANPLAESGGGSTPLHDAVGRRRGANIVRLLLANDADVNMSSKSGFTPLMMAAGVGDGEVANLLLQGGADASLRAGDGLTAADIARQGGHLELAAEIDRF